MTPDPKTLLNWQYARLPISADPEEFGPFADLVRIWNSKRGRSGALPARRDFDFTDFRSWLGKVSIARIERKPFQIRFVLWGTQLTEWWGVDYTNKVLGEASLTPEAWKLVEGRYFEIMDNDPFIGIVNGYLDQHDRPYMKVMGIDLPLSDGKGLSHVISAHIEIEPESRVESILHNRAPLEYI
ncbi:PAS domain-containing protein [Hwanghaeella sp.]|uniref:PAS domain-containing protein n=1 Tax=Hwanghaeella sp. TaxID=2605943 RepID=UPI003CCC3EEC